MANCFARVRVGRLVELRADRFDDCGAVARLSANVVACLREVGPGAIICADLRAMRPVRGPVASAWSRAMKQSNAAVRMSAILLDPANTLFNLQITRIVECATNPLRHLFTDLETFLVWLKKPLGTAETEALRDFLQGDIRLSEPPMLGRSRVAVETLGDEGPLDLSVLYKNCL